MKERPILFTGPMIRAILEGRKTVTRRAVKDTGFYAIDAAIHGNEVALREREALSTRCPFGQPDDRLWVREAWAADAQVDAIAPRDLSQGEPIWYPADFSVRQTGCSMISKGRGRPSIHMPRWASRILLEITAVRIERLQDISEKQALAEGVELEGEGVCWAGAAGTASDSPVESFRLLWELINGAGSWNANPWVWVVEFKRVTP
ncbi:hypothetical protein QK382_18415 [Pseudomonas aeruginosa]|nr:hypothetical protein [Pseudomonas aeruginosa]HCD9835147.1 hypothetical protein [Pseudomonas aeruginosa]HCE0989755.1 hypothetical protein [Pseudomonas aeruginosa]HCE3941671.1 hypothetical protein [Pseudomonas aeruginosa]